MTWQTCRGGGSRCLYTPAPPPWVQQCTVTLRAAVFVFGFTGRGSPGIGLSSLSLSRRGFSHCSAINQYLISAVKQATLVTTARLEICVSHEGQLTTHHWSPAHHLAFFLSCSTRRVLFTNPIPAQRDYFKILRQATRLKLLLGLSLPQHHDSSPST